MTKRTGRGLESMSVADLQREIARRQRSTGTLERKRAKLLKKLAALDAQIAAYGGSIKARGRTGGGTRPRNEMSLVDALAKSLKGKTMSVAEASEAVQKYGYKTTAANFRTMVNIALIKGGKFKRVERGQYTAKRGPGGWHGRPGCSIACMRMGSGIPTARNSAPRAWTRDHLQAARAQRHLDHRAVHGPHRAGGGCRGGENTSVEARTGVSPTMELISGSSGSDTLAALVLPASV